jgi:hypothetical protein
VPDLPLVDASRMGFFFGAGASIEFGIPSMKSMTTTFAEKIRNKASQNMGERKIFDSIYTSLAKAYEDKVDLEAIFSVIVGLKEKEHINDNIGEMGLFILGLEGIMNPAKKFTFNIDILNSLENKFKRHIRNKVVIPSNRKIDRARNVYFDFFKRLCEVTVCDNATGPDSHPSKYTHTEWTFFTTNYDNVMEDFWVKEREYSDLNLGFKLKNNRKIMHADEFVRNNINNGHPNTAMQLIKLHGSVNWTRNKNGEIEEHAYNSSLDYLKRITGSKDIQEDIIIYPLSQKQLYFTPFIQLFRILDAELRKRVFWIIIGYSFRDVIIRTMFERALMDDNKRKLLLVHSHATEQIKPLFQRDVRDRLICLDRYFGRNYVY